MKPNNGMSVRAAEGEREDNSSVNDGAEQDGITRSDWHTELAESTRKDSYFNPLFHLATANVGKAVAR